MLSIQVPPESAVDRCFCLTPRATLHDGPMWLRLSLSACSYLLHLMLCSGRLRSFVLKLTSSRTSLIDVINPSDHKAGSFFTCVDSGVTATPLLMSVQVAVSSRNPRATTPLTSER